MAFALNETEKQAKARRASVHASREQLLRLARVNGAAFNAFVLKDEATGAPIRMAPMHRAWHRLADKHSRLNIIAHIESAKALAVDTPIPTPDGWREMGDLREGDQVFAGDGSVTQVVLATPVMHNHRCYRVAFSDGSSVVADAEHRWLAWTDDGYAKGRRPLEVTTEEMLRRGVVVGTKPRQYPAYRWRVPIAGVAQYPEKELPLHPYVLGAWLGDGDRNCGRLTYHPDDRFIFDRCLELTGLKGGVPAYQKNTAAITQGLVVEPGVKGLPGGLTTMLRPLGVLCNKHIPEIYMQGSEEQRLELLAGLLDTDGTADKHKNRVTFCSAVRPFAEQVLELVRSLGIKAALQDHKTYFLVSFTACRQVFRLPRKMDRLKVRERSKELGAKTITAIEPVDSVPVRCIQVAHPEHTYLCGRAYTVTHNTQNLSIGRVLFELGRNPNLRTMVVSNTVSQAQKLVKTIAGYIERSEELHEVFPHLKKNPDGPWTLTQLAVERKGQPKDPSVQATGVHGSIVGARIDLLILDDVLDYENVRTPMLRDDLWNWMNSTLIGRLTMDAKVICVGNAYHKDDILHRLEKNPLWHTVRFPVLNENGETSWPERWPLERIAQKKVDLGPLEFARQLMCQPRSEGEARFKREWIDICLERGNGRMPQNQLIEPPPGCSVYTGVDLAVQTHSSADLTAFTTIMVWPNGDREILNIESGRLAGPQIIERIQQLYRRYQGMFLVENNACFAPGTRVLTQKGYKAIETIEPGDMVWTHQARWRPVTEVHQGYSKTMVEAKAQGVLPVKATPNHWFWLREAGRTPGRQGGHYRPVGDAQWVSYGFRDKDAYAAVALPKWDACAPVLKLPETANKRAYEVPVTEELALVLGLYMAEGHSTKGQVYFTLHEKEGYLAELIERVIPTVCTGSITRSNHQANTLRITISNTQLAQALHIGTGVNKCLPLEWLGWPLALRLALVRGWLLGDGCALQNNKSTKWPVWMLNGQSCSRNWMLFVRATLNDAGITSALAPIAHKKSTIGNREIVSNGGFKLSLSRDDSRKLRQHMTHAAEAERWERWFAADIREALHASNVRLVYEGGHGWSKVPLIEEQPYQEHNGVVFNLTVEEDHSYTVEEFIVHNAQDFLLQFLRAGTNVPVRAFTTGRNKIHPEFGVESLAAELSAGKWIIPNREGKMHTEIEALVNEMLYYDPKSHTGDRLMSIWMAREAARMGNIKAESGYMPTLRR